MLVFEHTHESSLESKVFDVEVDVLFAAHLHYNLLLFSRELGHLDHAFGSSRYSFEYCHLFLCYFSVHCHHSLLRQQHQSRGSLLPRHQLLEARHELI